jgi:hypothetical protein
LGGLCRHKTFPRFFRRVGGRYRKSGIVDLSIPGDQHKEGDNTMSLINKKLVIERETASYKLDQSTVELVRFYSEFIGSPQEHVVNEALVYIFRKDRDFGDWLKAQGKPNLLRAGRLHHPAGGRRSTSSVAAQNLAPAASLKKA